MGARRRHASLYSVVRIEFCGPADPSVAPELELINATTGEPISAAQIHELVVGAAAEFLSAGLRPGDPVLVGCS